MKTVLRFLHNMFLDFAHDPLKFGERAIMIILVTYLIVWLIAECIKSI